MQIKNQRWGRRLMSAAAGCAVIGLCLAFTAARAETIPYRAIKGVPPAVNRLGRAIAQAQRDVVCPGGDEAAPCFSSADQDAFEGKGKLRGVKLHGIESAFKKSTTFAQGVAALKKLPQGGAGMTRQRVLATFRQPLYSTWAQNGHIGADGTTDAGYAVEKEIAGALTNDVKTALESRVGHSRPGASKRGR